MPRAEIRSIDLQRRGTEFVLWLNKLLKRYSPQQADKEAQGRVEPERDNSRCLREISISATTDCCAVTAGEGPFATNNHLIQTLLLFHTQHGRKHNSIKIQ